MASVNVDVGFCADVGHPGTGCTIQAVEDSVSGNITSLLATNSSPSMAFAVTVRAGAATRRIRVVPGVANQALVLPSAITPPALLGIEIVPA